MTRRVIGMLAAAWVALAAACEDGDADSADVAPDAAPSPRAALLDRLEAAPPPAFDVERAVDRFEQFVTRYPRRVRDTTYNQIAADFLAAELAEAGYEVRLREYEAAGAPVRVVEGILLGVESPERYAGIVAHYDTVSATEQGAYDNGSGVALALTMCELLARVETRKTIACVFFDGEEQGRLGSRAYVEDLVIDAADGQGFAFEQVFGFDMVGLSWPGYTAWKLHAMLGLDTPALQPHLAANVALLDAVARDLLALPEEGVELHDVHFRNSDENSFKAAGVPALRFAGGRNAYDYAPWHGPDDTVQSVYDLAGGRDAFAAGYAQTVELAYYVILAYDGADPLALPDLRR